MGPAWYERPTAASPKPGSPGRGARQPRSPPRCRAGRRPAVASDDRRTPTPAEALERLGALSLRELSMDSLLQTVADLARTVMPGNPETSVLLLVRDRPSTVVHTGELALDLDETQYERGHGPCLDAARTGEMTEV